MAWNRCWEKQEEWKPSPPSFPPPSWMTRKRCWEEQEENLKPRPPSFPPPSWMTRKRCWEEQDENLKPRPPSFPPPAWEEHDKDEEFEYVFEEEWWPEKPPPAVAVPPPPPPIPLQLPLPLPEQDEVDEVDVLVEVIDGSDDEWHSDGRVNIAKYWQEAWQQQHPNLPVPPPPKPVTVVPDWSDLCKAAAEPETEPDICCQKLVLEENGHADPHLSVPKAEVSTQTDDAGGFEKKEKDLRVEKEKEKEKVQLDDLNPGDVSTQTDDAGGFEKKEKDLRVEKEKEKEKVQLDDLNPGDVATQTDDAGGFEKKQKEKWHFLDLRVEKEKEKKKVQLDDLNPGDACDAISQVACEQPAGGFERVKVGFGQGSTWKSSMRPCPLPPYNKPRKRIAKHVPPPVRREVTKETATPKPSLSKELSLAVAQPKSLAIKRDSGTASKRHSWMS